MNASPSDPGILRITELSCGYPSKTIVSRLSHEAVAGRIIAILGPNGSGKSTFLKTLAGLVPPLGGTAEYHGSNLLKLSPQARAKLVAVVPQDEPVEFAFTIREMVALGRLPSGFRYFESQEDEAKIQSAIERCDLVSLAEKSVFETSGGERQRALIARAVAQEAPILLLDEPSSHLDVGHSLDLFDLLKSIAASGKIILIAIHQLDAVPMIADEAILITQTGEVVSGGAREILLSRDLDAAYNVTFDRIESGGRLWLNARRERS